MTQSFIKLTIKSVVSVLCHSLVYVAYFICIFTYIHICINKKFLTVKIVFK